MGGQASGPCSLVVAGQVLRFLTRLPKDGAHEMRRPNELTLYQFQYRSEVELSGSSDIADAACKSHRRANSAGVDHASAEWGRLSL